jgi:hypothetical protein
LFTEITEISETVTSKILCVPKFFSLTSPERKSTGIIAYDDAFALCLPIFPNKLSPWLEFHHHQAEQTLDTCLLLLPISATKPTAKAKKAHMELHFQAQPPAVSFQVEDYCYYYYYQQEAAAQAKPGKPRGRKKVSNNHSKFVGVRQRPSGRWVAEIKEEQVEPLLVVWAASSNRRPRTARRLGWHGWVTRGGETTEVEREYSWICGGGGRLIFFVRDAGADTVLFAPFFSGCGT